MINLTGGFHAYVDTVNTRAHYATVYEYRQNQDNQELFQLMTALVNKDRLKLLKMWLLSWETRFICFDDLRIV